MEKNLHDVKQASATAPADETELSESDLDSVIGGEQRIIINNKVEGNKKPVTIGSTVVINMD